MQKPSPWAANNLRLFAAKHPPQLAQAYSSQHCTPSTYIQAAFTHSPIIKTLISHVATFNNSRPTHLSKPATEKLTQNTFVKCISATVKRTSAIIKSISATVKCRFTFVKCISATVKRTSAIIKSISATVKCRFTFIKCMSATVKRTSTFVKCMSATVKRTSAIIKSISATVKCRFTFIKSGSTRIKGTFTPANYISFGAASPKQTSPKEWLSALKSLHTGKYIPIEFTDNQLSIY